MPRPSASCAAALAGVLVALSALTPLAAPASGSGPGVAGGPTGPQPYGLVVDGQLATGRAAYPADPAPTVLLVFCHGFGGAASNFDGFLADAANRGYVGVGMDYRGAQGAWKVQTGWRDTLAATLDMQHRFPSVQRTIVWGISMGGEVSGLAVAHAPHGTYQDWVEDAGVEDLVEDWATVPGFEPAIQAETGGTPLTAPQAYLDRSPVAQGAAIAAEGLQRVFIQHAAADNIVTPTQAQELTAVLASNQVPVSTYVAPAVGHIGGWGYEAVLEKARGLPDWPTPVLEGTIGFVYVPGEGVSTPLGPVGTPPVGIAPAGFVPPVSPPALP